jgi:hypothetical protein
VVVDQQNQRRQLDRRSAERRHALAQGGARREERRKGSRRRQLAGLGLMAAAAFAGVRSYHPQGLSSSFGYGSGTGTVDVHEENFRLPTYSRATLEPFIQEAAALHGVSPDLVRAVVQTESQFNPLAVSPVGAQGLMQLMPNTAKSVGLDDPFDPRQNVIAGAKYLSMMLERFNGNTALALAGYNAGPNNVKRYRGIPPFRETRGYVKKIQNLVADSDAAFSVPDPPRPKVRRASLRAGKASSKGALKRASRASKASSSKRGSITKARVATSKAKVGRARTTAAKKATSAKSRTRTSRGRGTRA